MLYPAQQVTVTTGATGDINKILFINDSIGYMVGGEKYETSELLSTSDGGRTWNRFFKSGNDSKGVYGIACDGQHVVAVGYEGKLYTPDADNSWQTRQTSFWEWYQGLSFATPEKGFIVSGEGYALGCIYRLDPSMNAYKIDSFAYQLCDIRFSNAQVGYTCGYGSVLKTEDGGDSWVLQNIQGDFFRSISAVDPLHVWIAGYNGSIIHTDDGGQHWEKQRNGDDPFLAKYRLRAIVFKNLDTGYAAGDKGLIVKTTDGGKHWSVLKSDTDKDLKCITIHPDGSLWIGGSNGLVLHITE